MLNALENAKLWTNSTLLNNLRRVSGACNLRNKRGYF